jgi:hypothetical protein
MTTSCLIALIATAVIGAGYFAFRYGLKLIRKPIPEITLTPIENPTWRDSGKMTALSDWFLHNGFTPAGQYACLEIPFLKLAGFVLPAEQMSGVIYDHPTAGIWMDIYVHYTDGGGMMVSNAPAGDELDHMPGQVKFYSRESSPDELLKKLRAERKKDGGIAITPADFASDFEDQYKKEMKWRMDRVGPTQDEIMRVAVKMAKSVDSARLQQSSRELQKIWIEEKNRPASPSAVDAELPRVFQKPEMFRQRLEQKSAPLPRMPVAAFPVYLIFMSALTYWCYYGYRYNQARFPVSITEVLLFLVVFLVVFVAMMCFRVYHLRVRMAPVLKRLADLRPGAFLFVAGSSPTLFYAREKWLGKLSFREGSEHQNAFTRLDVLLQHAAGSLEIGRKSLLTKMLGWGDRQAIELPESDFTRKYMVSGTDAGYIHRLLSTAVPEALRRLEELGNPLVEIDRSLVSIQIDGDLSSPRKETALRLFLEQSEIIIEAVAQQTFHES